MPLVHLLPQHSHRLPACFKLYSGPVQNSLALNSITNKGVSWGDTDGDGDEDYIIPSFNTIDGQLTVPVFCVMKIRVQDSLPAGQSQPWREKYIYRGAMVMDANNDGKLDVYFTRSSTNTLPDLC